MEALEPSNSEHYLTQEAFESFRREIQARSDFGAALQILRECIQSFLIPADENLVRTPGDIRDVHLNFSRLADAVKPADALLPFPLPLTLFPPVALAPPTPPFALLLAPLPLPPPFPLLPPLPWPLLPFPVLGLLLPPLLLPGAGGGVLGQPPGGAGMMSPWPWCAGIAFTLTVICT